MSTDGSEGGVAVEAARRSWSERRGVVDEAMDAVAERTEDVVETESDRSRC